MFCCRLHRSTSHPHYRQRKVRPLSLSLSLSVFALLCSGCEPGAVPLSLSLSVSCLGYYATERLLRSDVDTTFAMAGPGFGLVVDGLVGLDPDHQLILRLLLKIHKKFPSTLGLCRSWEGGAKEAAWGSFLEPSSDCSHCATVSLQNRALGSGACCMRTMVC